MSPTRRAVLATGGFGLLGACLPRQARVGQMFDGPVQLGFRWVAGQAFTYDCLQRWTRPGGSHSRLERWSYVVREVRADVATLSGRLVGLGGDGPRAPLDRERAVGAEVRLRLSSDGSIVELEGDDCAYVGAPSVRCFGAQLPHRALAVHLPREPVRPAERWTDPELGLVWSTLMGDAAATVDATTELYHLRWEQAAHPEALLGHDVAIVTTGGPTLRVTGTSRWDTVRGAVVERNLLARIDLAEGDDPGELAVQLSRIR